MVLIVTFWKDKALVSTGAFYCFEKKEKKEELILPSC
jgi:hypothetical protein